MSVAINDVLDNLTELPPFPKVTSRLLYLLDEPTVSIDELSDVISTDPSLVLKVLHLSNSPFYMLSKKVETVKEAVFVLGIHTLKTITTAITIQQGLSKFTPRPDIFDRDAFWKHSYATAITASKICSQSSRKNSHKLYLAGLIHDIGKLIISYHWPETWKRFINIQEHEQKPLYDIENDTFNTNHAEIASTLCRRWQFPNEIVDLIRDHHRLLDEDEPDYLEKNILQVSNDLVKTTDMSFPPNNNYTFLENVEIYEHILEDLHYEVSYQFNSL